METIENNKLIAEFMGNKNYSYCNNDNAVYFNLIDNKGKEIKGNYHTDWNWLMQVVEKIESLENHGFTIYRKTTNINGLPIELANTRKGTKIEAVYNACISFIKWYNENK